MIVTQIMSKTFFIPFLIDIYFSFSFSTMFYVIFMYYVLREKPENTSHKQ